MKSLMNLLIGIAVIVGVVALVGASMPAEHEITRSARFTAPRDAVFGALMDFAAYPQWRTDVERLEILEDDGEGVRFREHGMGSATTYRVVESIPPSRLEIRVEDEGQPFGGSWTLTLQPFDNGTSLTITEAGVTDNPFIRILALVWSPAGAMERYLTDLRRSSRLQ